MPTHHRITLVVREEPEGHGTLFLDWGSGDSESLEALAVIPKDKMVEDPRDFASRLANTLSTHLEHIAGCMVDATSEGPLLPIGAEHMNEAMERLSAERAEAILRFLAWLGTNDYTIYDGPEKGPIEVPDILHHYVGDVEVDAPINVLLPAGSKAREAFETSLLKSFTTWIDEHERWYLSALGRKNATMGAEVLEDYLAEGKPTP